MGGGVDAHDLTHSFDGSYKKQEPFGLVVCLTSVAGVQFAEATGEREVRYGSSWWVAELNYVKPTPTIFELEALEGLPCGCVAAAFRARPWDVAVVSLEAKGPHCILAGHTSGQILRLGDPSEFDEDEDDE